MTFNLADTHLIQIFTFILFQGEDGAGPSGFGTGGYEFGVDPNEDPELALVCIQLNR